MTNLNEYMTVEQQEIIDQLNELTKDEYSAGYNKYNLERTMRALKTAQDIEYLEKIAAGEAKSGVADTLLNHSVAEYNIENIDVEIADLERQIKEKQAQRAIKKREKELLEQLEATGFQSILEEMKEERRKEIENIEWIEVWTVEKEGKNWRHPETIIRCNMILMEKNNEHNKKPTAESFILYWNERARLVDFLKCRGAKNLIIDKQLLTQKLQKEFNIL